jgi:hypothetical protein
MAMVVVMPVVVVSVTIVVMMMGHGDLLQRMKAFRCKSGSN